MFKWFRDNIRRFQYFIGYLEPDYLPVSQEEEMVEFSRKEEDERVEIRIGENETVKHYQGETFRFNSQGQLHSLTRPAVIARDRDEFWINGELHRENGPAIVFKSGRMEYYLHDKRYRSFDPVNGLDEYFDEEGKRHRDNAPALITSGGKFYYVHGEFHNENGPAYEGISCVEWRIHGKLHNLKGPARITFGNEEFWINGKQYSYEEYNIHRLHLLTDDEKALEEFDVLARDAFSNGNTN